METISYILKIGWVLFFASFATLYADTPPIEGKALTFQGLLVDAEGVPYGTDSPEKRWMRFSITSREDGGVILWQSRPLQIEIQEGLFTVRLGMFQPGDEPIDEDIFTGNDTGEKRRFMMMEVSTGGADGPYVGLFRRDLNPSLQEQTLVDSHIPVPGMPFVVSAMRVQGSDVKEGGLRITEDLNSEETLSPDLELVTSQPNDGLTILHNENVGAILFNRRDDGSSQFQKLLSASGKTLIKGPLQIEGAQSRFSVRGDLKAVGETSGRMEVSGQDDEGRSIRTDQIRAIEYRDPDSDQFSISLTDTAVFHKLDVFDPSPVGQQAFTADAQGLAEIQIEEGVFRLAPGASLSLSSYNFGPQSIRLGPDSDGITAMGFFDREQISPGTSWPYQMIPHGLSILNTLQLDDSMVLDYRNLQLLLGDTTVFNETRRVGIALVPGTVDQPLHRHDLRSGSDPDALVDKLNTATNPRIVRRRISDDVAWLYEPNTFLYTNYFDYTDGQGTPGVYTSGGLIARWDSLNTYFRGGGSGLTMGSLTPGIEDFFFYQCRDINNCPDTAISSPYLSIQAAKADLSGSLTIEDNVDITGNLILGSSRPQTNGVYIARSIQNASAFVANPNPFIHAFMGEGRIQNQLILHRDPVLRSNLIAERMIEAERFSDRSQPLVYFLDPSNVSSIRDLTVSGELQILGDLQGQGISSSPFIYVYDSASISGTLTAEVFRDVEDPYSYYLDPLSTYNTPTSLRNLELTSGLILQNQASIGGDFISTADLSSDLDLNLTTGDFNTGDIVYLQNFSDTSNPSYSADLDGITRLRELELIGDFYGLNLDSTSAAADLRVTGEVLAENFQAGLGLLSQRWIDETSSTFFVDPASLSRINTVSVNSLKALSGEVRTSVHALGPTTISSTLTVGQTLTLGGSSLHFGPIEVQTTATPAFLVSSQGHILAARQLELTSGFAASGEDSELILRDGLNQYATTGTNYLSSAVFQHNVYLLQSPMAVGSSDETLFASSGELNSAGSFQVGTTLVVGWQGLNATFETSSTSILLNSTASTLTLSNLANAEGLNLNVGHLNLTQRADGPSTLVAPLWQHPDGFQIDPSGIVQLSSLQMDASGSTGGGLILSGPLELRGFIDRNETGFSVDASAKSSLRGLQGRSLQAKHGLTQTPSNDTFGLKVRESAPGTDILSLAGNTLRLSSDGSLYSSGNLQANELFEIASQRGIVMESSTESIELSSMVWYLLAGKNRQLADSLHQHSAIQSIPLTDLWRRDIDNLVAETQTFLASGLGMYFQTTGATSSRLLRQHNQAGVETASIHSDGVLSASVLEGSGKWLNHIHGDDIVLLSLTSDDFATAAILGLNLANDAISGSKVQAGSIRQIHLQSGSITGREIADNAFENRHFQSGSLTAQSFASGAVDGTRFTPGSIQASHIASNTLHASRFRSQSVTGGHLALDSLFSQHLDTDAVRLYHLTPDSVDSSILESLSLLSEDFASGAIGLSEIATHAISSRIIATNTIQTDRILGESIGSEHFQTRILLSEDFAADSIHREKFVSQTLTSREIADRSLVQADFQDEAITSAKLADGSVDTFVIRTHALQTFQIQDDTVRTRHIVLSTLGSSEFVDYGVQNIDFVDNTIDPSNIATESIQARHIRTHAVTQDKITSQGIQQEYFQPFAFDTEQINNLAVQASHPAHESILSRHVINASIAAQDIASFSIPGDRLSTETLQTEDFQNTSIGIGAVAASAVQTHHFVSRDIQSIDIAHDTLTTGRFQTSIITSPNILDASLTPNLFADNAAVDGKFAANSIHSYAIASDSLNLSNFALNAVTSGKIAPNTLYTSLFADSVITGADIGPRQIQRSAIAVNALTAAQVSTNTFLSRHFDDNSLSRNDIASQSLLNRSLGDGSLSSASVATGAVTSLALIPVSLNRRVIGLLQVSTRTLASQTITSASIIDSSLTSRVVAANQIGDEHIVPGSLSRRVLANQSIEGHLILTRALGADKVANNSIEADRIATDAITHSALKEDVVSSIQVLNESIQGQSIATATLSNRVFSLNAIESEDLATAAIEAMDIQTSTLVSRVLTTDRLIDNRHIAQRTLTADRLNASLGAQLFLTATLSSNEVQDASLPADRIEDFSLPGFKIESEAILKTKLKDLSLLEHHFQDDSITNLKIGDSQIGNRHIVSGIILSSHIFDGSLNSADVESRSLDATKFETGAIWSVNVMDSNILTTHIDDDAIVGLNFKPGTLAGDRVAASAVTGDKLAFHSISAEQINTGAIDNSKLGTFLLLDSQSLTEGGLTLSNLAEQSLEPRHFQAESIPASKIGSASGEDLKRFTLLAEHFAPSAAGGNTIATNTLGDLDREFVFATTSGFQRARQADPESPIWNSSNLTAAKVSMDWSHDNSKVIYTHENDLISLDPSNGSTSLIRRFETFTRRMGASIATGGGYFYLTGGSDGTTVFGDVWRSADGELWELVSNNSFHGNKGLWRHEMIYHNGDLILLGGCHNLSCTDKSNQVWNSDDGGASWANSGPAGFGERFDFSIDYNGSEFLLVGGNSGTPASPNIVTMLATSSDAIHWTANNTAFMKDTRFLLPFDTDMNDVTFDPLNATTNNGVTLDATEKVFGDSAARFNDNDHLVYADDDRWDWDGQFNTLETWIHLESLPDQQTWAPLVTASGFATPLLGLIYSQDAGAQHGWIGLVSDTADGDAKICFRFQDFTDDVQCTTDKWIPNGSWTHLRVVQEDTNQDMQVYIDGTNVEDVAINGRFNGMAGPFWIGNDAEGVRDNSFVGLLDEYRLSESAIALPVIAGGQTRIHNPRVEPRFGSSLIAVNGNWYYFGGENPSIGLMEDVYFSDDNGDTFEVLNHSGFDGRKFQTAWEDNDSIYVYGGLNGSGVTQSGLVDSQPNGDFVAANNLPQPLAMSASGSKGGSFLVLGGQDASTNATAVAHMTTDQASWSTPILLSQPEDVIEYAADEFLIVAKDHSHAPILVQYNHNSTSITQMNPPQVIREVDFRSPNHFLGTGEDGSFLYSTNPDFSGYTLVDYAPTYKSPLFGNSSVYALRNIGPSQDLLVKFPWDGGTTFGSATDLTPGFSDSPPAIDAISLNPGLDLIFMISDLGDSTKIHRISTDGSGISTYTVSPTPRDGIIVMPGEVPYNPFIPFGEITSLDIENNSIHRDSVADKTITSEDFKFGGVDSGSFSTGSISDGDLSTGALTTEKWGDRSIGGEKFAAGIVTNNLLADNSLFDPQFADQTLLSRNFAPATLSSTHVTALTLSVELMGLSSFTQNALNGIDASDIRTYGLHGTRLSGLSGASLADESITTLRLADAVFTDTHLTNGAILNEHIIDLSIQGDDLRENLWEGSTLAADSLKADQWATESILSDEIANNAVLETNIRDLAIDTSKVADEAIQTGNIDSDAVNVRTLASLTLTSRELADGSIRDSEMAANTVTGGQFNSTTIQSAKLSSSIFQTTHFDGYTLGSASKIEASTITSRVMQTNTLPANKFTGSFDSSALRTGSFHASDMSGIDSSKIAPDAIHLDLVSNRHSTGSADADLIPEVKVSDTTITDSLIANQSLLTTHIGDDAFDLAEFTNQGLQEEDIRDQTLTDTLFTASVVTSGKFALNTLGNSKISPASLDADKLADNALESAKLSSDLIEADFALNAITADELAATPIFTLDSFAPLSLQTQNFALDTLSSDRFTGLTAADFSGLNQEDLQDATFSGNDFANEIFEDSSFVSIHGDRISNNQIEWDNLASNLGQNTIADNAIDDTHIDPDELLATANLVDDTVFSSLFPSNSLTSGKVASATLNDANFMDDAIQNADLASDFRVESPLFTDFAADRLANASITEDKLSSQLQASEDDRIAAGAITDAKLSASAGFGGDQIEDDTIDEAAIADGALNDFANNTVDANNFNRTDVGAISAKIKDGSLRGWHFADDAVTEAKQAGQIGVGAIENDSLNSSNFQNNVFGEAEITDSTIERPKLSSTNVLIAATQIDTISISKFDGITGAHIANRSLDRGDFEAADELDSTHISDLTSEKFSTADLDATALNLSFDESAIGDDALTRTLEIGDRTLSGSEIQDGTLDQNNLADGALQANEVTDGAITHAKLNTAQWDGLFDGNIIPTTTHQHEPFMFEKPARPSGYTAVSANQFGRENFYFRSSGSTRTLAQAINTCQSQNAQVCSINQLQRACSGLTTADPYWSSQTTLMRYSDTANGSSFKESVNLYPAVDFSSATNCDRPAVASSNARRRFQFLPVNNTSKAVIEDIYFTPSRVYFDIENRAFTTSNSNRIVVDVDNIGGPGQRKVPNDTGFFSDRDGNTYLVTGTPGGNTDGRVIRLNGDGTTPDFQPEFLEEPAYVAWSEDPNFYLTAYVLSGTSYLGLNNRDDERDFIDRGSLRHLGLAFSESISGFHLGISLYADDGDDDIRVRAFYIQEGGGTNLYDHHNLRSSSGHADLLCPGDYECFVSYSSSDGGGLQYIEFQSSNRDNLQINDNNPYPILNGKDMVALAATTGTNRKLYVVSSAGELYQIDINNDGSYISSTTPRLVAQVDASITLPQKQTRIRFEDKSDPESRVFVTGLEKHILMYDPAPARFACCKTH